MADIKEKIKYYEQRYFTNDEPVPFVGGLKIYPVTVKDYYSFYSAISCFTIDKNEDNNGIAMSNLEYLYYRISKDEHGIVLNQFITLLELIFHIEYGIRCTKCNKVMKYEDINKQLREMTDKNNLDMSNFKKQQYLESIKKCPDCNVLRSDNIKFISENGVNQLLINDIIIDKRAFDELRKIVCFQNIPDYDD